MQRLALALAVTAITLCWGSVAHAQVATAFYPVGPTVCQPLPSWYPRGWELMHALSLRHLYLWIFLLSSGLLRLSGSLSISASVNSYRTAGPSPTISASRVVVVIKVSSLPLSESFRCRLERKSLTTLIRLAVVLVPLLVAALFWAFYRYQVSSAAKGVTAAQSSASPSKSQQTAPFDERLSNAERAIMFSIAPLTSLSAMVMTPVDPDPVASFRQLIALPPGTAREAPRIDPRRIRTMVDRGVVEYASAKTDGDRARGARLIQTAALVGYPPARDLLARNYPQSEAVRSVVPAKDVIRYALVPVMDGGNKRRFEANIPRARATFRRSGTAGCVRDRDSRITARRLAPAAHSSGRHFSGLAGARARCVWRACAPVTGRRQRCRSRMLSRRTSAQVHRNDTAVRCGGGGVKAPRFADVESARRTLAMC